MEGTAANPAESPTVRVRGPSAPTGRDAVAAGIAAIYRAAGLPAPEHIVWGRSPIEIERSRKVNWVRFAPGRLVRRDVVDEVILKAWRRVHDTLPRRHLPMIQSGLALHGSATTTFAILNTALDEAADREGWPAGVRLQSLWRWLAHATDRRSNAPYMGFHDSRWLPHDAIGILTLKSRLADVSTVVSGNPALDGLQQIARFTGAMIPHARVCWVSERPDVLCIDDRGRLHCGTGPAVHYGDGWSLHAWKGVPVPSWLIERQDQIDEHVIGRERNRVLRRCMIEIMTPERYIATGAPKRAMADATGTLWRKRWFDADIWQAVEVVNGTAEPDGTQKHYFLQVPPEMRSPLEAVAWTYGMSGDRYQAIARRT